MTASTFWTSAATKGSFGNVGGRKGLLLASVTTTEDPDVSCERLEGPGHIRIKLQATSRSRSPLLRVELRAKYGLIQWDKSGQSTASISVELGPGSADGKDEPEEFCERFTPIRNGVETICVDVFAGEQHLTPESARSKVTIAKQAPSSNGGERNSGGHPSIVRPGRQQLFICYARGDVHWMRDFKRMLHPVMTVDLNVWSDGNIAPGDKWMDRIDEALRSSSAALLLVTSKFFDSDFICDVELPFLQDAERNGKTLLLPVAVSSSLANHTMLHALQWVNSPDRPLDLLQGAQRNREIQRICEKILERLRR